MKTYLECWMSVAKSLLSQALAGEPQLVEASGSRRELASELAFAATLIGEPARLPQKGITTAKGVRIENLDGDSSIGTLQPVDAAEP